MERKLRTLQYKWKREFVDDLMLIWTNCLEYNADPANYMRQHALILRKQSEKLVARIPDIVIRDRAEIEAEERRLQHYDAGLDGERNSDDESVPIYSGIYPPEGQSLGHRRPSAPSEMTNPSTGFEQPKKPQCWEHGCNGRLFSSFSNLLRHQRRQNVTGGNPQGTTAIQGRLRSDSTPLQPNHGEQGQSQGSSSSTTSFFYYNPLDARSQEAKMKDSQRPAVDERQVRSSHYSPSTDAADALAPAHPQQQPKFTYAHDHFNQVPDVPRPTVRQQYHQPSPGSGPSQQEQGSSSPTISFHHYVPPGQGDRRKGKETSTSEDESS